MIEAVAGPGGTVLTAAMAGGTVAYVDADWLPRGRSGPVPAIVVDVGPAADVDAWGSRPLLRLAQDVGAALETRPTDCVLVQGVGLVAAEIRRLLADRGVRPHSSGSARPAAVVDVTGDPGRIVDATRIVDDLGVVVLAGDPLGRRLDLDCYTDVHARGLTLIGVALPSLEATADEARRDPGAVVPPAIVRPGESIPDGALWYRVEP